MHPIVRNHCLEKHGCLRLWNLPGAQREGDLTWPHSRARGGVPAGAAPATITPLCSDFLGVSEQAHVKSTTRRPSRRPREPALRARAELGAGRCLGCLILQTRSWGGICVRQGLGVGNTETHSPLM